MLSSSTPAFLNWKHWCNLTAEQSGKQCLAGFEGTGTPVRAENILDQFPSVIVECDDASVDDESGDDESADKSVDDE